MASLVEIMLRVANLVCELNGHYLKTLMAPIEVDRRLATPTSRINFPLVPTIWLACRLANKVKVRACYYPTLYRRMYMQPTSAGRQPTNLKAMPIGTLIVWFIYPTVLLWYIYSV